MKYLLVDTAYDTGIAAIFSGDQLICEKALPLFANQSRYLFPAIQTMIKEAGIKLDDLEFIAAGIGPGSYTGMRVGAMIGKCFAFALKKPLVGICSMQAFSPEKDGPFTVLIDARVSGTYFLNGELRQQRLIFKEEPRVLPIETGLSLAGPYLITLPGNRIRSRLESLGDKNERVWIEQPPSAKILGEQAFQLYKKGNFSTESQLELLYLRATQAEIEKHTETYSKI